MTPNPTKNVCCNECHRNLAFKTDCAVCPCHSIPKDSWVEETITEFEGDLRSIINPLVNPYSKDVEDMGVSILVERLCDLLTAHNKQVREDLLALKMGEFGNPELPFYGTSAARSYAKAHNTAIEQVLSLLEE